LALRYGQQQWIWGCTMHLFWILRRKWWASCLSVTEVSGAYERELHRRCVAARFRGLT
jgi:ABC-type arginine/histidine transport system permease subunit